jgi:signal transduction histidine kinase
MTPPRQWLRPPRTLLLALFLVTLVAVSALGWFGRSLLEQERVLENQRAEERQEQAADRIATKFREAIAETGERLGYSIFNSPSGVRPDDGVLLRIDHSGISAEPPERLLYRPDESPLTGAQDDAFVEGEALEFQQSQLPQALDWFRKLADAKDSATRAGALMRMGRVLTKMARADEARATYARLATIDSRIAGVPAELLARLALLELSKKPAEAESIQRDLVAGRWALSRGQFEFYWSEASRFSNLRIGIPASSSGITAAVSQGWADLMRDENPSGQKAVWVDQTPYLLIWSGRPEHRAVLTTRPESIFRQILSKEDVSCALADSEGRILLGSRTGIAHATVRAGAETHLPWTLYVRAAPSVTEKGMVARQRYLMLVTAFMVLFLVAGAHFIARAIRTEAAVSRMQSDFVSAVSHEFRSPLTSMRQLSEILALGRVSTEERRQVYYDTLVRETIRLQRLIESLLNFGRMEAGVRKFNFEETDPAGLIASVAAEFEQHIAGTGRHIQIAGPAEACMVDADPEALTVAVRNLVDNALKYAPESPTVWLECGVEQDRVAIRVRDHGPGIPRSERKAIFRKFVRGSAASAASVKGSGVGLAMVQHIVTLHRGDIRVTSEAGLGSTFTIFLPRIARST